MATADGGAAGGGGSDSPPASGDIDSDLLDIGSLQLVQEADEESWLLDTAQGDHSETAVPFSLALSPSNEAIFLSKKSLVNKLDHIAKSGSSGGGGGGPERVVPFMLSPISSHNSSHGSGRSNLSPGMTSYLRQNLASTPLTTNRAPPSAGNRFDPRTFTRPKLSMPEMFRMPPNPVTPDHQGGLPNRLPSGTGLEDLSGLPPDFDLEDDMDPITFVDLSTPHATPRQPGAHSGGGGGGNRGATLNQRSPSNGHSPVRQLGGVGHTNNATFDRRNSGSSSNSTPPPLGQINQRGQTNATFDAGSPTTGHGSGTMVLPTKKLSLDSSTPLHHHQSHLNATFDMQNHLNATFDKQQPKLNATFDKHQQHLNATFDKQQQQSHLNATFDKKSQAPPPAHTNLNATFGMDNNRTFEVNSEDCLQQQQEVAPSSAGSSFNVGTFTRRKMSDGGVLNRTPGRFSRESSQGEAGGAHHHPEDDRFSSASEASSSCAGSASAQPGANTSSSSVRLNDVGDVQQLARMQEESLREPVVPSPPSGGLRSATLSPSSPPHEHSPVGGTSPSGSSSNYPTVPTDNSTFCMPPPPDVGGGVNSRISVARRGDLYRQHKQRSVGGQGGAYSQPQHHNSHQQQNSQQQQYSSQDSLPDSPYSSQSLDSQSAQAHDRLRRSMPNLNKIRGRGGGGGGVGGGPANGGRGGRGVGASSGPANNSGLQRPSNLGASTRHHSSDPRLQQQPQPGQQQSRIGSGGVRGVYGGRPSYAGPPTSHTNEAQGDSTFCVPAAPAPAREPKLSLGSRIARPAGSGIPRPGGSRLPTPRVSSGIPKPSGSSQPGSRASSVGPRRQQEYY